MSDARKMVLQMLADGKISVEESERLLAAIDEGSGSKNSRDEYRNNDWQKQKSRSDKYFDPFISSTKLAFDIKNLAKSVQQTVQDAVKKTECPGREFKGKMKEFGNWMQDIVGTMANEMAQSQHFDSETVDFQVPATEQIKSCKLFNIENVFGEIKIQSGKEFKMHVTGRVKPEHLGEYKPLEWFTKYGMKIDGDCFTLAFDKTKSTNAILDLDLTLPEEVELNCRGVSSDIKVRGRFNIKSLKTVSGNIRVMGSVMSKSVIETVSGDVQVEGGEIALEIKSTSGDFVVREAKIEELHINSVSGDIILGEASVDQETEVSLATTSGEIIVDKITGPWKEIEAITRTGSVTLDWKGDVVPLNNQGVRIRSGADGASFKAESVSGDIIFT